MKTEEFYKKIQEKVGETEMDFEREFPFGKSSFQESPFGESQFLEWNKQDVWQRIEQKQTKRKKPFVWWQAAAASVVLLGGLGMYFYNNETVLTAHNQVIKEQIPAISTQPTLNPTTTESTQLMVNNGNHKNYVERPMAMKQTAQPLETNPNEENLEIEEPIVAVNETQNSFSSNETEIANTQQTPVSDNYRFVPYQGFVEKRVVPKRRERVAILEIPDDEEDYNQTPQKEKKTGLVARLSRKIGKKSTEPNEELPAVNNGKPNKVWAFVKESFKNETMAADSTNR